MSKALYNFYWNGGMYWLLAANIVVCSSVATYLVWTGALNWFAAITICSLMAASINLAMAMYNIVEGNKK